MLHVANNYVSSKVHQRLVEQLADEMIKQYVVVPIRNRGHRGKNKSHNISIEVFYVLFANNVLRYLPLVKVVWLFFRCYSELLFISRRLKTEVGRVNALAHNLWSDGMILFLFSFFFPINYVLVVRNTDINYFVARMPHYRWLIAWLIRRSKGLVFVSEAHHERFRKRWPTLYKSARQVCIIPNGIDNQWLESLVVNQIPRPPHACFVAQFVKNKNVRNVIKASTRLYEEMGDFRLIMAGDQESSFLALTGLKKVPPFVEIKGSLSFGELRNLYRASRVLVMPSFTETFGLVYLEALSQGCSVIHSQGEGIDGMWFENFIASADPDDVDSIYHKLKGLIYEYPQGIDGRWTSSNLRRFGWSDVARQYQELFQ